MVNVSTAWRQALFDDQRDYKENILITLQEFEKTSDTSLVQGKEYFTRSGSASSYVYTKVTNPSASNLSNYYQHIVLDLTNANIWGGSFLIDDAVSSDSDFQIGGAIINKASFSLNNMYDSYSDYDFYGAKVRVRIGLDLGNTVEWIDKGRYIVNKATYSGEVIQLECYDYMYFFDVAYETNLTYPTTIQNIVNEMCNNINVTLITQNYPHKDTSVNTAPEEGKTTCREVLAWCCQICGCFARFNNIGQLEIKWYPQTELENTMEGLDGGVFDGATPYATGDSANGGSFNPWSSGATEEGGSFSWINNIHMISSVYGNLYSNQLSFDDVVITGVRITVKVEDSENSSEAEKSFLEGSEGYVIEISGNPFITASNVNTIKSWLGTQLIGFTFRKANVSHGSDPSIEAGDCAIVFDRKGNAYPIVVSATRFGVGTSQTTVSAAQDPLRNSATRFSVETKNYVELRHRIKKQKDTLEQMLENASGLYSTDVTDETTQATIHYLHNKPELNESDIRIMVSTVGITVTANGTDQSPTWYGLTVDGQLIANILSVNGIEASWINAGNIAADRMSANVINAINGSTLTINAARLNLSGYVTFTNLSTSGQTSINGGNIQTNSMNADRISTGNLTACNALFGQDLGQVVISDSQQVTVGVDLLTGGYIFFRARENSSDSFSAVAKLASEVYTSGGSKHYNFIVDVGTGSTNEMNLTCGTAEFAIDKSVNNQFHYVFNGAHVYIDKNLEVDNNLDVSGTKSRKVTTEDYGERLLYSYELASPMFGDVGEGTIGDDGKCYIGIDSVLAETVSLNQYQVFLQKYGEGECYVTERKTGYFIVEGTPNLSFGWEIKAKQSDFDQKRMEKKMPEADMDNQVNYAEEAVDHLTQIKEGRTAA